MSAELIISIVDLVFIVVEGIFIWIQFKDSKKTQKEIHQMLQDLTQIKEQKMPS